MGEQIAPVPIPGASINEETAGEKPASEKIQKPTPTTYYIKGVPLEKNSFISQIRIAYSEDYVKKYADLYNSFLNEPKEQTVLFSSWNEAFI